jgi:hypothetical protein
MTWDGSNVRLFVNGSQVGTPFSAPGPMSANIHNLTIGGSIGSISYPFNGTIENVKIYSRALSADEIRASYNIGSSINPGNTAQLEIYSPLLTKGTHKITLCTPSTCRYGYMMII